VGGVRTGENSNIEKKHIKQKRGLDIYMRGAKKRLRAKGWKGNKGKKVRFRGRNGTNQVGGGGKNLIPWGGEKTNKRLERLGKKSGRLVEK